MLPRQPRDDGTPGSALYYCDGASVTFTATPTSPPPKPKGRCCKDDGTELTYSLTETKYAWQTGNQVLGPAAGGASVSTTVTKTRTDVKCVITFVWDCNGARKTSTESVSFSWATYTNAPACVPDVPNGNPDLDLGNIAKAKYQASWSLICIGIEYTI